MLGSASTRPAPRLFWGRSVRLEICEQGPRGVAGIAPGGDLLCRRSQRLGQAQPLQEGRQGGHHGRTLISVEGTGGRRRPAPGGGGGAAGRPGGPPPWAREQENRPPTQVAAAL